jgi:hypothetical protein
MGWMGHVACLGMVRNEYKILIGNLDGAYTL